MPTVAYLTNLFPSPVEPYVIDEIRELRNRGIIVVPGSARRPSAVRGGDFDKWSSETLSLEPLHCGFLLRAAFLCISKLGRLKDLFQRALSRKTPTERRLRALLHTLLGIYYAAQLEQHHVRHIHVHHGYFGSWVAMVAARVLDISFSMTLHGSDLLINAAYLDVKLKECQFCVTISEFNRRHILENYPEVDPAKIFVRHLGIDCAAQTVSPRKSDDSPFRLLAVGRLHAVKDHAFLVRACSRLKSRGLRFVCVIAGEGPERKSIERLICDFGLRRQVRLLGELSRQEINEQYDLADLIVLTSRSEGIPLTLMEAMARGKCVLAPAITGIPELVEDGVTGFLYRAGSLEDFVARVELIRSAESGLNALRRAAHQHVLEHFNLQNNTAAFCNLLVSQLQTQSEVVARPFIRHSYANSLLQ
jgi:colanic acid/amylovoran biosynthesis glycosyltransferase